MLKRGTMVFLMMCVCPLLLISLNYISNAKIQPFQLMLASQIDYPCVFSIEKDGFLEVEIGPWEKMGKPNNYLEYLGDKAVKCRKRLSAREISIFNNLITKVKTDGDAEMDAGAEGMGVVHIYVTTEGKSYRSLYNNFGPFSTQECVQNVAYKLIQSSPIITPYSAREAIRFYETYGSANKAINGKFKNLLELIERHDDYIIIDEESEKYKKIIKEDWGDLASEKQW